MGPTPGASERVAERCGPEDGAAPCRGGAGRWSGGRSSRPSPRSGWPLPPGSPARGNAPLVASSTRRSSRPRRVSRSGGSEGIATERTARGDDAVDGDVLDRRAMDGLFLWIPCGCAALRVRLAGQSGSRTTGGTAARTGGRRKTRTDAALTRCVTGAGLTVAVRGGALAACSSATTGPSPTTSSNGWSPSRWDSATPGGPDPPRAPRADRHRCGHLPRSLPAGVGAGRTSSGVRPRRSQREALGPGAGARCPGEANRTPGRAPKPAPRNGGRTGARGAGQAGPARALRREPDAARGRSDQGGHARRR